MSCAFKPADANPACLAGLLVPLATLETEAGFIPKTFIQFRNVIPTLEI